ncbi:IS3 family transposase [Paenibacillus humicola]|uniref:IS3 family transposase n=1 Tax=Paenibacillus humicola TaxID=3110540 RepID=UPI003B82FDEF
MLPTDSLARELEYSYCHKGQNQIIDEVHRYINFYNHKRFQKKLNNLSPVENRTKAA